MTVTKLNEYQLQASTTAAFPEVLGEAYCALGLNGEAGEVAEKVKKAIRDNGGVFTDEIREAIAKELGDVLWYLATLSTIVGYTLQDVAEMNLAKLKSRQERGTLQGSGDER